MIRLLPLTPPSGLRAYVRPPGSLHSPKRLLVLLLDDLKSGLTEMFIKSECASNALAFHGTKGIAIDEIPFFVAPRLPEFLRFRKDGRFIFAHLDSGRLL
jgi:hypothetical protein